MVHDTRVKLQRAQTTDILKKKITTRPTQERLVHNNILRSGSLGSKSTYDIFTLIHIPNSTVPITIYLIVSMCFYLYLCTYLYITWYNAHINM